MAKTEATKDEMDKASESLSQILQTIGAAIYQQDQAAQAGAAGQPGPETPSSDEKKKGDKKDSEPEEGEVVS